METKCKRNTEKQSERTNEQYKQVRKQVASERDTTERKVK